MPVFFTSMDDSWPRMGELSVYDRLQMDLRVKRAEYQYNEWDGVSWYDNWAVVLHRAPRCCPPHLPVFGVVEESRDE